MYKEKKIASYTAEGRRIQLLKMTECDEETGIDLWNTRYQIRVNRKVVETYTSENLANRKMASIITSELLQQKSSF